VKADSEVERPVQRLRDQLRIATSDAILAAAEAVYAERGLHAARMEEIAARAGVAVGTLYNHFADRSALLDALLVSRRRRLLDRLDAELDASKGAPFSLQVGGFVRAMLEHVAAHAAFTAVLIEAEQPRSATLMRELEARTDKLMQRGAAQKALRKKHAEILGGALLGILRGVLERELRNDRGAELASRTEAVVDLFLHGAEA
jgi:AcrR family transcriptional regulator